MHELAITRSIVSTALRYAGDCGASRVNAVYLRIGVLRGLDPDWLRRYFRYIGKGTAAGEAEVYVMTEPAVCDCHACGGRFDLDVKAITNELVLCPFCAAHDYELISGMEFILSGIEVEGTEEDHGGNQAD